jgi:hypothetical protein
MSATIILALSNITFSQIGSIKVAEEKKEPQYDSTLNFLGKNPELYKGTKLYLPGKSKQLRGYGYDNFKSKKNFDSFGDVYKCCAENSKFNTNYGAIAGKTFEVLDVAKKVHAARGGGTVHIGDYILTLKNLDDGSIAYYKYSDQFEHSFPFVDMRYFEKIKRDNVGKRYIVKENSFNLGKPIVDIEGKELDSVWNQTWKCTDVLVEEQYFQLALLLENQNGVKIVFDTDDCDDEKFIIPLEKANEYSTDFGSFWNTILRNRVAVGMSKKMVEISWGQPEDINQTVFEGAVTEQWVYKSGNYVYFKNGIVEAIQ